MSLDRTDITTIREIVLEALEAVVTPRFDDQDRRFERQDKRFERQDERFDRLEADIAEIKTDVRSLKHDMHEVKSSLSGLDGRVEALEADVKEPYAMMAAMQKQTVLGKRSAKLSFERKVLQTYEDVLLLAKEAGITLPR